jgi:TonB family protein
MSSPVAWRTPEGTTIDGKFPLRQWLGGSDHSAVFLTERMLLGVTGPQKAAIKLIAADSASSADQLARWRAAAQLSHPHLVRVFDFGQCKLEGEQRLYVVTEYAEEDLSQILPHRPLTPGEVSDMLPPLLDALSYLHSKGFVHTHIRPSNLLAVGDQLKLSSDQIFDQKTASIAASGRRRHDAYDAPETAAGVVLPESDLWSVGTTLINALTRTPITLEGVQRSQAVPQTMPEPFRGIARECLHLDPKRRISIGEINARLQPAGRSVPAPELSVSPTSSRRAPVTIAILVAALIAAGIVFFSHRKSEPHASPASSGQVAQPQAAQPATPPQPSVASNTAPAASQVPTTVSHEPASNTPALTSAPAQQTQSAPSRPQSGIVHRVIPDVPKSARNTITGKIKVTARVDVDGSGNVTAAKLTSPGPSQYFARLALNAAQHWEFAPAQVDGQPAPSSWLLHFRFGRRGTEVSPERVSR